VITRCERKTGNGVDFLAKVSGEPPFKEDFFSDVTSLLDSARVALVALVALRPVVDERKRNGNMPPFAPATETACGRTTARALDGHDGVIFCSLLSIPGCLALGAWDSVKSCRFFFQKSQDLRDR
jgi:hypothetical protein